MAVYGYASASAFSLRRRIFGEAYRKQALGVGMVSVLMGLVTLDVLVSGILPSRSFFVLILLWVAFWGVLYWVDTSIRAARYADPLLRDSLHWSKVRLALWTFSVGGPVGIFLLLVLVEITSTVISSSNPLFSNPAAVDIVLSVTIFAPVVAALVAGFVVFPVVARRSADLQLKKHFTWFAVYALVFFGVYLASNFFSGTEFTTIEGLVLVVDGYFLMRSAKALVPVYRFNEAPESASSRAPGTATGP